MDQTTYGNGAWRRLAVALILMVLVVGALAMAPARAGAAALNSPEQDYLNRMVWDAFLASDGHYKNLTDPSYNAVGVAVVTDSGGVQ